MKIRQSNKTMKNPFYTPKGKTQRKYIVTIFTIAICGWGAFAFDLLNTNHDQAWLGSFGLLMLATILFSLRNDKYNREIMA